MDQRPYPGPPLLFHLRMNILFVILWATDLVMFVFAVEHTMSVGGSTSLNTDTRLWTTGALSPASAWQLHEIISGDSTSPILQLFTLYRFLATLSISTQHRIYCNMFPSDLYSFWHCNSDHARTTNVCITIITWCNTEYYCYYRNPGQM